MNYYDPKAKCSACGFGHITTRHEDKQYPSTYTVVQYRMVRTCSNCQKVWRELPLDHDEVAEQERFDRMAKALEEKIQ